MRVSNRRRVAPAPIDAPHVFVEMARFYVVCDRASGASSRRSAGAMPWPIAAMHGVLVVRPSSLGDIVYALAVAADIRRARPELAIDWVSEPGFAPLIGAVSRRARRDCRSGCGAGGARRFAAATWRDMRAFRDALRSTRYAAILDLQEQVKGALIARLARGVRHGFDRASIREPLATLGDDVHHRVPRDLHFLDALPPTRRPPRSATRSTTPPRWNLRAARDGAGDARAAVCRRCCTRRAATTSCGRKRIGARVLDAMRASGARESCCRGEAPPKKRAAAASRAASRTRSCRRGCRCPMPRRCSRRRALAIGVDTGFTHLAAALGTPTIALFTATDRDAPRRRMRRPACARRRRRGSRRRRVDEVIAAAGAHLRRAAAPTDWLMRASLYTLLWWLALPFLPLRLWWRGRARAGLSHARRRALRPLRGAARGAGNDVLWIHAVSVGETRAVAPLIERLQREASADARSC